MKKYILPLVLIACCFCSCAEDEIQPYHGGQYIYFSQLMNTDKEDEKENGYMSVSFNNYPTDDRLTLKIGLGLIGSPFAEDAPYRVVAVEEDAAQDNIPFALEENYELPSNPVFGAGLVSDTLEVTLIKTDQLTENVKLCLKLEPNEYFQNTLKQYEQIKIVFNNVISQPEWWTSEVNRLYLGTYSRKKYEEFVKCTGITDFGSLSTAEKRAAALEFKRYVAQNNIMDEDEEGNEFPMKIPAV